MKEVKYKIGKEEYWVTFIWDKYYREWSAVFTEEELKRFIERHFGKKMIKLEEHRISN